MNKDASGKNAHIGYIFDLQKTTEVRIIKPEDCDSCELGRIPAVENVANDSYMSSKVVVEDSKDSAAGSIRELRNIAPAHNTTISHSETGGTGTDPSLPKRIRNKIPQPWTWKKNFDRTKRVLRPACSRCRFKCQTNIPPDERQNILAKFWALENKSKRKLFLQSVINEDVPHTRKVNASKERTVQRNFYFDVNGQRVRVCKQFFTTTLNISSKSIATAMHSKY